MVADRPHRVHHVLNHLEVQVHIVHGVPAAVQNQDHHLYLEGTDRLVFWTVAELQGMYVIIYKHIFSVFYFSISFFYGFLVDVVFFRFYFRHK